MPYGRTVIMWAVCDKCKECIEHDSEYGSKREAVDLARLNGWTVSKNGVETCIAVLEEVPAVDAEPVRHGRWKQSRFRNGKIDLWPPTYECSECHYILFGSPRTNFCHNCGAKMDKEEDTKCTQQ